MPERIQQKRTKGWRKPPGAMSVVRGTDWGNPFRVGDTVTASGRELVITPAIAVALYREHLVQDLGPGLFGQIRRELGGHDLMCFCRLGAPCHADILLEIANS